MQAGERLYAFCVTTNILGWTRSPSVQCTDAVLPLRLANVGRGVHLPVEIEHAAV